MNNRWDRAGLADTSSLIINILCIKAHQTPAVHYPGLGLLFFTSIITTTTVTVTVTVTMAGAEKVADADQKECWTSGGEEQVVRVAQVVEWYSGTAEGKVRW